MGCDIHAFLDVKDFKQDYSQSILFGELPGIQRNYTLFSALAKVRDYGNVTVTLQPKGIPDDLEFEQIHHFFQPIAETWKQLPSNIWYSWHEIDHIPIKDAKKKVSEGEAFYNARMLGIEPEMLITRLGAHSFTWLYLKEIQDVLRINDLTIKDEGFLYAIDILKMAERKFGERSARLLIYFDN